MRKKTLYLLLVIFSVLNSSCNDVCECTVTTQEYYPLGNEYTYPNNYVAAENQFLYVVYPKNKDTECSQALRSEYGIIRDSESTYGNGVKQIICIRR